MENIFIFICVFVVHCKAHILIMQLNYSVKESYCVVDK